VNNFETENRRRFSDFFGQRVSAIHSKLGKLFIFAIRFTRAYQRATQCMNDRSQVRGAFPTGCTIVTYRRAITKVETLSSNNM